MRILIIVALLAAMAAAKSKTKLQKFSDSKALFESSYFDISWFWGVNAEVGDDISTAQGSFGLKTQRIWVYFKALAKVGIKFEVMKMYQSKLTYKFIPINFKPFIWTTTYPVDWTRYNQKETCFKGHWNLDGMKTKYHIQENKKVLFGSIHSLLHPPVKTYYKKYYDEDNESDFNQAFFSRNLLKDFGVTLPYWYQNDRQIYSGCW